MKVENFCEVKNQFIIHTKRAVIFQSYETTVATYDRKSEVMYVSEKKYSCTTSKYTNRFLNEYPWATVERVEEAVLNEYMEEI